MYLVFLFFYCKSFLDLLFIFGFLKFKKYVLVLVFFQPLGPFKLETNILQFWEIFFYYILFVSSLLFSIISKILDLLA